MQTFIVIIAIITLILYISITVCVTLEDETLLSIKYGFLKFKINLNKEKKETKPKKEKKPKKPKKSKKTQEGDKPEEVVKKKKPKKSIVQKIEEIWVYLKPVLIESKIGLKKILKCFKFRKVNITMFIAGKDAHKTAIKYAKTSVATSNAVSLLQIYGDIEVKKIEIYADFLSRKSAGLIYFEIKFRPLFVLHSLNVMIIKIICVLIKVTLDNKNKKLNK